MLFNNALCFKEVILHDFDYCIAHGTTWWGNPALRASYHFHVPELIDKMHCGNVGMKWENYFCRLKLLLTQTLFMTLDHIIDPPFLTLILLHFNGAAEFVNIYLKRMKVDGSPALFGFAEWQFKSLAE